MRRTTRGARPLTPAMVDQMNLDKSMAFYKDRFADASDFTFVFVGSFDLATMKPLVERYLGALPSTHRKETWKDVGDAPADAAWSRRRSRRASSRRARRRSSSPARSSTTRTQRIAIRAMADDARRPGCARRCARISAAPTASPSSASYLNEPRSEFTVAIDFGCDPKRTDDLVKSRLRGDREAQGDGPDREAGRRHARDAPAGLREANTKQNGYWLSQIYLKYQYGEDPATLLAIPDFYKRMGAAEIKKAAIDYLTMNNYVQVALFPEKK